MGIISKLPMSSSANVQGITQRFKINPGENISAGDIVKFVNNYVGTESANEYGDIRITKADNSYVSCGVANESGVPDDVISITVKNDDYTDKIIGDYKVAIGENVSSGDFVKIINEYVMNDNTGIYEDHICKTSYIPDAIGYVKEHGSENDLISVYDIPSYISSLFNQISKSYIVGTDTEINAGDFIKLINEYVRTSISDEYVFNVGNANCISSLLLSDNKVLVLYCDNSNFGYDTAQILTVDGANITGSTEYVFNTGNANYISPVLLSDNKVLVLYCDGDNSNYGTSQILDINGTTITGGTEYVFNSGKTYDISSVSLPENKVLVSYRDSDNSGYGTAQILTINDTTITGGTEYVFNAGSTQYISSVLLSDNKVLLVYKDYGNSSYGIAQVLTINDTTITAGTEYIFNSGSTSYITSALLSENKVLIVYRDGDNSQYGTAIVLTINDTTITAGIEYVFNNIGSYHISSVLLSENKVLVSYEDETNSGYGTAQVLTINDTTITGGTEYVFNAEATNYISSVLLSDNKVLVVYDDEANSSYGTAILFEINDDTISNLIDIYEDHIYKSETRSEIQGIATSSGSSGDSIIINSI